MLSRNSSPGKHLTYPVDVERLDIFTRFLTPARTSPRQHKLIETTEIMLQMVASGRGVAALPRWLVEEYAGKFPVFPVRLGEYGVDKQLFFGIRETDADIDYMEAFLEQARRQQ